jgi:hypothetical protein
LQLGRHVANLIEKQGAAIRLFESADAPGVAKSIFRGSLIRSEAPFGFIRIPRNMLATAAPDRLTATGSQIILTESFGYVDTLRALLRPYIGEGYPPARFAAELVGTNWSIAGCAR